ncbi:CheR family methyltransferase [Clostridium magnum]|uniref:protein-glutamate O-methyltransferase n=1 Tax=Clostridium magnum DSM 2767 TaxID=1121326 RepID=A0A161YNP6_9CLOT|nr:protein-glutamate O-methyltransferase CheR [Clostridium magnum]KZL92342.1 chemotaxis protein methyltransferase [Clostridium magnum DSM 2767]SHH12773.1 chemotaxis protein methyltransferase CheR [Clostridium magnum DSM 2767]
MLTDDLYKKYVGYVFNKTGLCYELNKKYFVVKRIEDRMASLGIKDFKEYYGLIKFSEDQTEFYKLINDLTINETYFFREFPQLQNFAEDILPLVVKKKQEEGDYNLRLWSAACSSGEEPYTLAIILSEMLECPQKWNIEITASDINTEVLETAKIGSYEERSIREVPLEYLSRYFNIRDGKYKINSKISRMVEFKRINLFDLKKMKSMDNYDFIFCRNALIYFSNKSREIVVNSFYNSLNRGGFIFLGHSESIGRVSSAFRAEKIGGIIVHSKY